MIDLARKVDLSVEEKRELLKDLLSLRHGGGAGTLRIWTRDRALICEIEDTGHIDKPLVGRQRPATDQERGFGLWLVNQMCDLVQVRTFKTGSVVRLHMARV